MSTREPPRLVLAQPPQPVAIGLPDEELPVAAYFEAFPWESAAPDAANLSAEDFLSALGP